MALKSTVYRISLHVSDMDRGHFAQYPLVIARHPSETDERLMMRIVAFCLYADPALRFGAGLSNAEEPDLVQEDLTGAISLWIEVGLPEPRWVAKALSKSDRVVVLAFGSGFDRWVTALNEQFPPRKETPRLTVFEIGANAKELARLAERNATITCTIEESTMWLTGSSDTVELNLTLLRGKHRVAR